MIKTGRVVINKTPSAVSGRPATRLEEGEPVFHEETPVDPGLKKMAALIDKPKRVYYGKRV